MSRRRKEEKSPENVPQKSSRALPLLIAIIVVIAGLGAAAYFFVSSPQPHGGVEYGNSGSGTEGSNTNTNPIAIMKVISYDRNISGDIKIELYRDKAPITVDNFIRYAEDGFYNGLIFHRVISGFVAQGGAFYYNSSGYLNYKPPTYDPIINEADNGLSNVEGTIAMARTTDPNSATSQFYFNLVDNNNPEGNNLDPGGVSPDGYCVFGKVIDGWDIVKQIGNVPTNTQAGMPNVPVVPIFIESVTIQGA